MGEQSTCSFAVRCQELHDAVPVRIGEVSLRPSLLDECLRFSELHANCPEGGKEHHGAAMLALLTVKVDSGMRLSIGGKSEVHYPLK